MSQILWMWPLQKKKKLLEILKKMIVSQIMGYLIILRWVSGLLALVLLEESRFCLCGWFFHSSHLRPGAGLLQFVWAVWAGCGKQRELAQGPIASSIGTRTTQSTAGAMPGMVCMCVCVWDILVGSYVGSYFFVLSCVHFIFLSFSLWFMFYLWFVVFPLHASVCHSSVL